MPKFIASLVLLIICSGELSPAETPSWFPPLDPAVTTGILPSGATYYILPHGRPEKRLQIRLVVKVGSMDKTPMQTGWAHILEHMAFRAGKKFHGNSLVKWLEEAGMKLEPGVNSRTGFDSPVYQLELPSDRPEMLPRALEAVEDWMGGLILTDDLEEEKLIIKEEWRQRTHAWSNLRSRQLFQKEWEETPQFRGGGHCPGNPKAEYGKTSKGKQLLEGPIVDLPHLVARHGRSHRLYGPDTTYQPRKPSNHHPGNPEPGPRFHRRPFARCRNQA